MRAFVALGIVAVACSACDSPVAARCGTTPVVEPRIEWGIGADGVRMGDTEEAVLGQLGEPDGDRFIDWYGTSHGFLWDEGPHAGVQVTFVWRPDTTRDVGLIELVPPYLGQTEEGVGIGSTRAEVECVYGPSQRTAATDNYYTEGEVLHWLIFEADTVAAIWMFDQAFIEPGE